MERSQRSFQASRRLVLIVREVQYKTAPDQCQSLASFLTKSCVMMRPEPVAKASEQKPNREGGLKEQPLLTRGLPIK
jgi:hypothetical protein